MIGSLARFVLFVCVCSSAGAWGCGSGESEPIGSGAVTRLEIVGVTADGVSLTAGASLDLEVGGLDSQGRDNEDVDIRASSSNEAVATVTGGAAEASRIRLQHVGFRIQAVAAGTATITFGDQRSGVTRDLEVTVTGAP